MPVYEKTTGGEVYLRGIDRRVSAGDRVDVGEEFAAYLDERRDFRAVDVREGEFREIDDSADGEGDGFDAAAFVDRTPMDDVVEDIQAGEADDHLRAVAEAADRVGVEDAVGQRRAELEE
ncbi:hypothetical protein HZS55_15890 [Halosimplex rubrum]|uniref:Uncharacterized protein n=1 Tax=Halosimplex rubrum TaxID=869889 RepID=A0A7D5P6P5_9EURY|nr:hypothetical protein [Halosimplex rubrum]QLH78678.1 hypothetical protein HZS55_15890 [Halosimplex rubrum]